MKNVAASTTTPAAGPSRASSTGVDVSSGYGASLSPQIELRLRLLPRIAAFGSRKWILADEERELLDLLSGSEFGGDRFNSDRASVMVKRRLDAVERKHMQQYGGTSGLGGVDGSGAGFRCDDSLESNDLVPADLPSADSESELFVCDDPSSPLATSLLRRYNTASSRHNRQQKQEDRDASVLRELFVETCFFARLGYLQPPSCLHCAYAAAVGNASSSTLSSSSVARCGRFVVWRKDGNVPLKGERRHEDNNGVWKLSENLVLVQCKASAALLRGEAVASSLSTEVKGEGEVIWKWDAYAKRLVSSHSQLDTSWFEVVRSVLSHRYHNCGLPYLSNLRGNENATLYNSEEWS